MAWPAARMANPTSRAALAPGSAEEPRSATARCWRWAAGGYELAIEPPSLPWRVLVYRCRAKSKGLAPTGMFEP